MALDGALDRAFDGDLDGLSTGHSTGLARSAPRSPSSGFRGYQQLGLNVTRYEGGFVRDWNEALDYYKEARLAFATRRPRSAAGRPERNNAFAPACGVVTWQPARSSQPRPRAERSPPAPRPRAPAARRGVLAGAVAAVPSQADQS